MAEERKIALTVEIGGKEEAIKSMADLKKARKDLQNAFLQGDENAVKGLKKIDDALGDLQDTTRSVQGDGIEPLKNSFRLFTEGLSNFDFGKIGTAFKGLGAAMKAVPIFLLVEGVMYLVNNFNELVNGTGILAKVLKPIGELFEWLKDGLYELTDALGLTNSALDEMGETAVKNAEKSKEALSEQNAEYDRQIKVAKAAGKSTVELEKAKQQAIIDTNVQIVKQIEAFVRAGGVLDEEKKKLLTASLEAIKNAKVEERVIELNDKAEKEKAYKTHLDNLKKEDEKMLEERKKKEKEFDDYRRQIQLDWEKEQENIRERFKKSKYDDQAEDDMFNDEVYTKGLAILEKKKADGKQEAEDKKKLNKEVADNSIEMTAKSLQANQALTDLFFNHQLKRAKGNEAEERRIKKRQFQVNKAFAITGAVIDGVRSVQAALTQTPPLSYILAALNGVLAAAAIAKIASAKFDDSGGGGASGGDVQIGGGAISGASAPAISQPNNTVTKIEEDVNKEKEKAPTQKVVVVESDITDKQKQVAKIEETATI